MTSICTASQHNKPCPCCAVPHSFRSLATLIPTARKVARGARSLQEALVVLLCKHQDCEQGGHWVYHKHLPVKSWTGVLGLSRDLQTANAKSFTCSGEATDQIKALLLCSCFLQEGDIMAIFWSQSTGGGVTNPLCHLTVLILKLRNEGAQSSSFTESYLLRSNSWIPIRMTKSGFCGTKVSLQFNFLFFNVSWKEIGEKWDQVGEGGEKCRSL